MPNLNTSCPIPQPHHIRRDDLHGKIDRFLIARLPPHLKQFRIMLIHPQLTAGRLDLAFKLHYLDPIKSDQVEFAIQLYDAHIHAFSLGTMKEPGNPNKSCALHFRTEFDRIHDDMRQNGFDETLSLIPLARDGSILNGAHRIASAIHLGLPVMAVETGLARVCYDYHFFQRRGIADWQLEAAVLKYIEYAPLARIAIIAGRGRKARARIRALGPVVYQKPLPLDQSLHLDQVPNPATGHSALTLVVLETAPLTADPQFYLTNSHTKTLDLARTLLSPTPPDRVSFGKSALYSLRFTQQRLRHQAIQILARLGIMQPVRWLYRCLRP